MKRGYLKNMCIFDWEWKISEFYLIFSLVFYKNHNKGASWISLRINLFLSQLEITFYYRRRRAEFSEKNI